MKYLPVFILLFGFGVLAGDTARAQPPAPSDFPLTVHVVSAKLVVIPDGTLPSAEEYLHVLIGGKKYILATNYRTKDGVILPGDYKARLVKNKQPRSYSLTQMYEFLFPDGKTMKFEMEGISE